METWGITLIQKEESRSDPANYRPVTVLSVISNVMEAIIVDTLMSYSEELSYVEKQQHGFRHNRLCSTNLLLAKNIWTEAVDSGTGVDVVYLAFSKTFDRPDYRIFLTKLQRC